MIRALVTVLLTLAAQAASADDLCDPSPEGLDCAWEKPGQTPDWGAWLPFADAPQRSFALLVGISDYDEFTDLDTARDVEAMREFLIGRAGYDHVHVLTEARVTRARLRELMIDELPERMGPADRFLFYWSGHGVTKTGRPDATGRTDEIGYMPLAGSRKGRYSTMIEMSDIREWDADHIPVQQALYLLDACFSGLADVAPKSDSTEALTLQQMSGPSRHIMTAGLAGEETIAIGSYGGSIFTVAVLEGISGRADTTSAFARDGIVTVGELEDYVKKRVGQIVTRERWPRSITPQLRDLDINEGEYFFRVPGTEAEPPPAVDAAPAASVEPKGEGELDSVIAELQRDVALLREELARQEALAAEGVAPGEVSEEIDAAIGYRTAELERIEEAARVTEDPFGGAIRADRAETDRGSEQGRTGELERIEEAVRIAADPFGDAIRPDGAETDRSGEDELALLFDDDLLSFSTSSQDWMKAFESRELPETFKDCDVCPAMVRIPGGQFTMGSPRPGESPELRLTIAPFAMSVGEVSVQELEAVWWPWHEFKCLVWTKDGRMLNAASAADAAPEDPSACVSHRDAELYVEWINDQVEGDPYRLPSEAEFEYVLRGGLASSSYSWPEELDDGSCLVANAADATAAEAGYAFPAGHASCSDGAALVRPAAFGLRSWFGPFNLSGNVWEWTADCWNPDHNGRPMTAAARVDGDCSRRVVKGGSFDDPVENLRTAYRVPLPVDRRQQNVGFRVVRDVP